MHYYCIEYKIGEERFLVDHEAEDVQSAIKHLSNRIKRKYRNQISFIVTGWKRLR